LETEGSDEVQMIVFALTRWKIISTGLKIFILCNMRVAINLIYMQGHALEELLYSAWALLRKKYHKKVRPLKEAILIFLCGAGNFSNLVCMWPT
jgi:hypothetical protein